MSPVCSGNEAERAALRSLGAACRRSLTGVVPSLVIVLALLCSFVDAAESQEGAVRFLVAEVGDSTLSFPLGRHVWVEKGMRGIAVDPRQRDVLVARFEVISVTPDSATVLITGQTMRVTTDHVVLLDRPAVVFFRRKVFWAGTLLGIATGVLATVAIGH
ncbi:MAG: hypothetical protein ABR543_08535 [Gemmatimonadaceae bacterium]